MYYKLVIDDKIIHAYKQNRIPKKIRRLTCLKGIYLIGIWRSEFEDIIERNENIYNRQIIWQRSKEKQMEVDKKYNFAQGLNCAAAVRFGRSRRMVRRWQRRAVA